MSSPEHWTATLSRRFAHNGSRVVLPDPPFGTPAYRTQARAKDSWTSILHNHVRQDLLTGQQGKRVIHAEDIQSIIVYHLASDWDEQTSVDDIDTLVGMIQAKLIHVPRFGGPIVS